MKRNIMMSAIFLFFSINALADVSFLSNQDVGWYFYQDDTELPTKKEKNRVPLTLDNASNAMTMMQEKMRAAKDFAILNPTEKNLTRFITLQRHYFSLSEAFGQSWQQVLLKHPELDESATHPISSKGREIFNATAQKARLKKIAALREKIGLVFVYHVDCPYCQQFSPILKDITEQTGLHVLAISSDDNALPEWPNTKPDNGIIRDFAITAFPDVVIVTSGTRKVLGHIRGFRAMDEFIDKLLQLTREENDMRKKEGVRG